MVLQNKKIKNFVSISSLTGKCAAQKLKYFCSSIVYGLWTVRPQVDNTHTEHNQQSTEDTEYAEKTPQTSPHNCKITGIQRNSQTST